LETAIDLLLLEAWVEGNRCLGLGPLVICTLMCIIPLQFNHADHHCMPSTKVGHNAKLKQ
jgi:hypothetical protein